MLCPPWTVMTCLIVRPVADVSPWQIFFYLALPVSLVGGNQQLGALTNLIVQSCT